MDHTHNLHANAPLHWGYSAAAVPTTPQSHWVSPSQSHGHSLKRAMSESDCEELYSEESSKEQTSPSETGSCQLMSRKKRRGVIEKKRRDRINSSLSELKRLVPSAYEKQGSAKLEKAEILQLTVEHLKNLQSKGMDSLSYDPQRFAMDYHIIGFRECAAEVARYLVTIEGMDIQDPLRLRLMSHLQYFAQQRELSAKGCPSPGAWTTAAQAAGAYQTNCAVAAPYQTYATSVSATSTYVPNLPTAIHAYPALSVSPNAAHLQQQQQQQHHQQQQQQPQAPPQQGTNNGMHVSGNSSTTGGSTNESMPIMSHSTAQSPQAQSQTQHQPSTSQNTVREAHHSQQQTSSQQQPQHYTHDHTHQEHQSATYIELTNAPHTHAHEHLSHRHAAPTLAYGSAQQYPVEVAQEYNPNTGLNYAAANGSKPYRPWGAEMAY